jgi:hypothetical protein
LWFFLVEGRKLEMDERPLWVQLYWGKDQREGRFVLQNAKLPKVRINKKKCSFLNKTLSIQRFQNPLAVVLKNVDHRNVNQKKRKNRIK